MAVVSVLPDWTSGGFDESADPVTLLTHGGLKMSYVVRFSETTPQGRSTEYMMLEALKAVANGYAVPQMWEQLDIVADHYTYVSNRSVRPGKSSLTWIVDITYTSVPNPLNADPVMYWYSVTTNEPIDRDRNGNAITNSAKETPDPPATKDFHDSVLHYEQNFIDYDHTLASYYRGAVNSDNFLGFNPGKVKMIEFKGLPQRVGALRFYKRIYEFQCRTANSDPLNIGWRLRLLDQGYREYSATSAGEAPSFTEIKDDNNDSISEPVLLDGAGKKLADGSDPVFLEFETDDQLPFNILGVNLWQA